MDAHHGHVKSELEQLKNDIANATKQKQSICKALEKKVPLIFFFTVYCIPVGNEFLGSSCLSGPNGIRWCLPTGKIAYKCP